MYNVCNPGPETLYKFSFWLMVIAWSIVPTLLCMGCMCFTCFSNFSARQDQNDMDAAVTAAIAAHAAGPQGEGGQGEGRQAPAPEMLRI
jgi:hypothetical protein